MDVERKLIPDGPSENYRRTDDLLEWMGRQFAAFGDIFKAIVYGTTMYGIRDMELAYHVLVENWQNYVKGQLIERVALLLGNGLMVSEGELWKHQRQMIQPAFHHKSVGPLVKVIASVNSKLLEKWRLAAEQNESVNVTQDVSHMALEVVLRFLLGDDYDRTRSYFEILSEEKARDMAFARSFRALGKVLLQVIEQRRKNPAALADALSLLMLARDPYNGQPMPDRQIIDEMLTLVVAGHETTASTLNWLWYLLSQHPEVEERLSDELAHKDFSELDDLSNFSYTRQIIDESMRLYPAGWLVTRKALADDRLGDYFVPAGTEIYIPPYFIQRHPNVWEDPDTFNPDRFQPENSKRRHRLATIPFSSGPRNCIGALFARVEMQIHVMVVAKHLRLRYTETRPIEMDAGVNLRSKYDFLMFPEAKIAEISPAAASV
ncbi:MAG: cytochrome P450 [Candidatus Acidiferrales bacterium]